MIKSQLKNFTKTRKFTETRKNVDKLVFMKYDVHRNKLKMFLRKENGRWKLTQSQQKKSKTEQQKFY